ncbi:unnamed protein product [Blepharisma stoltei]|uniref:Cysteine proteinase n=1 Tax=Blepharisma stoltei TaxID=1481888 RepID=A0AAU9K2Q6_9CILI|nr:unnamed protein product [Blepharisma stoltei]
MDQFRLIKPAYSASSVKLAIATFAVFATICMTASILYLTSESPLPALHEYELEEQEFKNFLKTYNKNYPNEAEYRVRLQNFRENLLFARVHNKLGKTWTLGVNNFADLSMEEFKHIYLSNSHIPITGVEYFTPEKVEIPTTIDWRQKGAVTPIKNQGQCGACWSFSTTASVEAAWFLSGHTLVSLSEQALIDCSVSFGTSGCYGGSYDAGFQYTIKYGLPTGTTYPYVARSQNCNTALQTKTAAKITQYIFIQPGSSQALLNAVAMRPVSVNVEADQAAWMLYKGGIVSSNCGTNLNHSVNIVGYNTTNVPPYWIVKNSWDTWWGEKGYIRIAIADGNGVCGINMEPVYAV